MKRLTFLLIFGCVSLNCTASGQNTTVTQTSINKELKSQIDSLEYVMKQNNTSLEKLQWSIDSLAIVKTQREVLLDDAQRGFARTLNLFSIVLSVAALLAIIVAFLGKRAIDRFETKLKRIEEEEKKLTTERENLRKSVTEAKSEVAKLTNLRKNTEKEIKELKGKIPEIPLTEKPPPAVQQKIDELTQKLRKLESLGGELSAEEHLRKGMDQYHKKLRDLALLSFNRAIEIKPDYAEAWFSRGVVLGELRRLDEALQSYDEAARHKEFMQIFFNRAAIYALKQEKQPMLENLHKSIKLRDANRARAKNTEDFKAFLGDKDFQKLVGE